MHKPLLPAPITPEIEQAIGQAPMVPLTADDAALSFNHSLYLHCPDQADMGLSPWLAVTPAYATRRGDRLLSWSFEDHHGYTHTLQPLDTVYVTREAFERKFAGVRTAA